MKNSLKKTTENETIYKKYKYLFEKIKEKSKTSSHQRKLKFFGGDIKKHGNKRRSYWKKERCV